MPVKTDREYRRFLLTELETREENNEKIVDGYATVFNEEYTLYSYAGYEVRESFDPAAFDETDMSDVIMQYDHEGRVFARGSNGTLTVKPDQHGLRIRADLGGTEIGRQLFEEIKGGYTTKMSIGFTVKTQERTEERDEDAGRTIVHRKITGVKKLYDVSAVSLPANDATEISARNFGEGVIAEIEEERLASLERQRKIQKIKIMIEMGGT
jgi:HK97 family phage prohead protease